MMILIWVLIGLAIYYFIKENNGTERKKNNEKDPVGILKLRYANGEIDEETYEKALKVLND